MIKYKKVLRVLLLCTLLILSALAGGCVDVLPDLDFPGEKRDPLTDQEFFAQLAAYTGKATDWSDELHAVGLQALQGMNDSESLDKETIQALMKEHGLVYETIAAASVQTSLWPPQYDNLELQDALVQGFAEENWLGALATVQSNDGGTLLLVITANMADPTIGQMREVAKEIWMLTNAFRRDNGLPALSWDTTGARIAQAKTEEMYAHGYFEHDSPITGDLAAQFFAFGNLSWGEHIWAMGENIAMINGYSANSKEASYWMELWENSPEHRDNLLSEHYAGMGAAVYQGEDGSSYAAQEFLSYMSD